MHHLVFICLCVLPVVVPSSIIGPRIINGEKAAKGQFPWQVAIFVSQQGTVNLCGGALISEDWVLTAAHCVQDSTGFRIALGSNALVSNDSDQIVISTEEYIKHENYSTSNLANDIALIPLPNSISLTDTIKPIALADKHIESGTSVTVSGWGLTKDDTEEASPDLIYVKLETISGDDCRDMYGGILNDGVICATGTGDEVQSTCEGDSGGPLVTYDDSNKPIHVGIVSYGHPDGCESGKPSGYTETSYFRDWIRENANV